MSESPYDVYVHDGHIVEIHRGESATVARIYGEDWNTQPMVQFHPQAPIKPAPMPQMETDLKRARRINGVLIAFVFVALLVLSVWLVLR